MAYVLRPYQKKASEKAIEFFNSRKKQNAIMVLPTGSGKSLIIADIASKLDDHLLIFQPSKEILEQNFAKLQSYGVLDCSIFSASFNSKEISRITFAMIGSVRNKHELFSHFKYVIVDECHGVNSKNNESMYNQFLSGLDCRVLGLTATPYRLSTDGFGGSILKFITRTRPRIFSEMIYHVQIKELSDQGYLAKMEYYQVNIVDPSKLQVNSTGADYTDKSVKKHYSDIDFNKKLKEIIERLIKAGRKNILVFTRFIDEAQELSDYFNGLSEMVSGETPKKEREKILNDFKSGEIRIVTNVGVLTTGFDFPELSTIVLARPTMSLALYYQMIGRAMRPHKSKESAWIIDLCRTYKRFGNVESLEIRPEKPNTSLWAVYSGNNQLTNKYYE
jgi:DNA repair protein RadD